MVMSKSWSQCFSALVLPRMLALGLLVSTAACSGVPATAANSLSEDRVGTPLKSESISGRYLAGRFARYLGDAQAAAQYYREALADDRNNDVLRGRTFRLLLSAGELDEALRLARNVRTNDREEGLAPTLVVIEHVRQRDLASANTASADIPSTGLNATLRPVIRAWVKAGLRQGDDAIKELDALNRFPQIRSFQQFHLALIQDFLGRDEAAEATYKDLLSQRAARTSRAVQAYAAFLARLGRRGEANRAIEEMLPDDSEGAAGQYAREILARQDPAQRLVGSTAAGLAEAFYGAARGVLQQRASDQAIVYLYFALFLQPDFDIARTVLGTIQEGERRWEEANKVYAKVGRGSALGWNARIRIAVNLSRLEKTDEGLTMLRAMADERRDRTDALVTMGELLRGQQKWDDAAAVYTEALGRLQAVDEDEWTIFYSRGIAHERAKKWDSAEKDFLRALELSPDQPLVLNYLGYSWVDQGLHLDRARGMIEKAVELRPRDGYIIDSLGWVLYRLGDYKGAVVQLERAVALRSDDPVINDHLGDAYWKVGRRTEARFQWERALLFKPESDVVESIRVKLKDGLN
ncbi:MAG: tetratricopeptide repeat protein [Alphaproteobacteria bacterium]|nr:tetratricopeptide repeat protein [Alphaproteobacteria bacterium]